MQLLRRCQIEVVYYVCDVGHTVVVGSPTDIIDLAILLLIFCCRWVGLVLLVVVAAAVWGLVGNIQVGCISFRLLAVRRHSSTLKSLVATFICWYLLLLLCLMISLVSPFLSVLDVFRCQLLIVILLLMLTGEPRIDEWLLNIDRSCFNMTCFSWRCIMIHINFDLVARASHRYCCILLWLKVAFLNSSTGSCRIVILSMCFFLLLYTFFLFLLLLVILFLFLALILQRSLFGLFLLLLVLLLLLQLYLMLSLCSLMSFSEFALIPFLLVNKSLAYLLCMVEFDSIVFDESRNCFSTVIDSWKLNEQGNKIVELTIFWIVIPTHYRDCALRLKHISSRRIVQNHRIFHISSYLGHVLGEYTSPVRAMVSEQSHCAVAVWIHLVHERISILW